MGDPHRADRRFTGYGPIRLRCGIRTSFRMVFASFLSLLLLLMVVLIVVSCDVGFLSAVIAPIGPCIALVEGYVLSDSLAFRKAGCAAPFRVALPGLPRNFSARHDRAVVALPACSPSFCARRSPLHGTAEGVPPISGSGESDTRIVSRVNDTVVPPGGATPVGVVCDAPTCCDGLPVQKFGPVSLHVQNPGNWGSPKILDRSVYMYKPGSPKILDRSVSRFFSSRSGSASSWLPGGASPRALSGCRSPRG